MIRTLLLLFCLLVPNRTPIGVEEIDVGFTWQCFNYHLELIEVEGDKCYFRGLGVGNHLEYSGNPTTREAIRRTIRDTRAWEEERIEREIRRALESGYR